MNTWLTDTFDATKQIRLCAYELESLAVSFYEVGNFHMSERLDKIGQDLHESSDTVHKAAREASGELLHTAQFGAFSTVRTVLALGDREQDDEPERTVPPQQAQVRSL